MCEPLTLAAVGTTLGAAGISAYSQYSAGQAQQKIAENNAMMAGWQQQDAMRQGAESAAAARAEGARVVGAASAAVAANGIDSSSGSMANLFAASYSNAELDAVSEKNNAARRAWGFDTEAQNDRAQGAQAAYQGKMGSYGSILGGFGSALSMGSIALSSRPSTGKAG
jgi:hypothetical protein